MHLNIFNGSFETASYALPNDIASDNPDLKELKQFLNMVTEGDEAQDILLRNFNKGNFTITDQDNLIYSGLVETADSVLPSDLDEDTLAAARSIAGIKKVKRELDELKETRDELADFIQKHLDDMKVLEQQVTDKTADYNESCAAIKALIGGL